MTDETNQENAERKYAGKFDTVEQLEEGYKNSAKIYQENEALKKQLQTPEDYLKPEGIALDDKNYEELKQLAKSTGLTQGHFDKLCNEWQAKITKKKEKVEAAFKEVGEENINVLKDYVSKNYPEKIAQTVLKKLVLDKEAREAALKHREALLNTSVPGVNRVNAAGYNVTYNDVLKAREQHLKNNKDAKLRDQYVKITAEFAKQKNSA